MITGREIWTAANQMVNQHGAFAMERASTRAAELAELGAWEGVRVFLEIRSAIEWLQDPTVPGNPQG